MKPSGGRLDWWEKAKWRNLWDSIKSKTDRHLLLLHAYRIVNIYSTQKWYLGNEVTMRCSVFSTLVGDCALSGLEKGLL